MISSALVRDQLVKFAPGLDRAIAQACKEVISEATWSEWEVAQGVDDLMGLSDGQDCAYDRPSIGASYALWYHGQRTHHVLRALLATLDNSTTDVRIVDLGCGTGATACAAQLWLAALKMAGMALPNSVSVEGSDASPFMVHMAQQVYRSLQTEFGEIDVLHAKFTCAPWTEARTEAGGEALVVASYLFDHSDVKNVAELSTRFAPPGG